MTGTFAILLFAAAAMVAVSYGWGMRGDLIGGEEGAILPGALLGFCIAYFLGFASSEPKLMFYFIALGMTGMFMGGTEPYAEAFHLMYWGDLGIPKAPNMKKGFAALAVKGAPWFGLCAAVISVGFSALTGRYSAVSLVVLTALLPVVRALGTVLFNNPFDPEKGKFPKIYFSETSREEWGGLWFMLLDFIIFEIIFKDSFALTVTFCGCVGGSVGWIISQLIHTATRVRMKNGKYFFGKFQENHLIDNWKIMEFGYGASGSLSIVVGFIICRGYVLRSVSLISAMPEGRWIAVSDTASAVLFAVWFAMFVLDNINHFIPEKLSAVKKVIEILHRPMLCYIPMALLFLGNLKVALFMSVVVLFWQAPEELCFVQLKRRYRITVPVMVSYIVLALLTAYTFIFSFDGINIKALYLLMCLSYLFCASFANIAAVYGKDGRPKNVLKLIKTMGSFRTVKLHYIFCIILTTLFLIIY